MPLKLTNPAWCVHVNPIFEDWNYLWGDWWVPWCFSDACLKGGRQTGCVVGDKSPSGCEEPCSCGGKCRCHLPGAVVYRWFLKQFLVFQMNLWSELWYCEARQECLLGFQELSVKVDERPWTNHCSWHTSGRKKVCCSFLLNMLVFKDQQRESVICTVSPKTLVPLWIQTGRCVGVWGLPVRKSYIHQQMALHRPRFLSFNTNLDCTLVLKSEL